MAEQNENTKATDVTPVQPMSDMTILPPDSGFLGRFLQETENMLRARAMRMSGLLRTLNESGTAHGAFIEKSS